MSVQPDAPAEPGRSPTLGLSLNLSSNNPFRNRAASPTVPSPRSPFDDPPPRPVSRNPFLDPTAKPLFSPEIMASAKSEPTAEELFSTMTIDDKKPTPPPGQRSRPPNGPPPGARRPGPNMPPRGRAPPPHHRPTMSQEDEHRGKAQGTLRPPPNTHRAGRSKPRPRSNSDTSIATPDKPLTEEERKKARGYRLKADQNPQPSRKRDAIDLLDMANVYGIGGVFHHDGPYDALNPHRNRKGSRRAPMQAFPEGSLNNSLGGAGPLNTQPDHATFMGNKDPEAFTDYGAGVEAPSRRKEAPIFDPRSRGSVIYGDDSLGLGPSTFLEGTPASRTAIQRNEIDTQQQAQEMAMKRQKSVAHRAKRFVYGEGGRDVRTGPMTSPEGVYTRQRSPTDTMPTGSGAANTSTENNPFFAEFDQSNEENISVRRRADSRAKSPTSPKRSFGLERRSTSDATSPDSGAQKGGLLARVKSLKGGRRQRPERPAEPSPFPAEPAPGTAA